MADSLEAAAAVLRPPRGEPLYLKELPSDRHNREYCNKGFGSSPGSRRVDLVSRKRRGRVKTDNLVRHCTFALELWEQAKEATTPECGGLSSSSEARVLARIISHSVLSNIHKMSRPPELARKVRCSDCVFRVT